MKSRIVLIFLIFAMAWGALIARAVHLQILPNKKLQELQRKQFETTVQIKARRGAIYDRAGKELAITVSSYSLFVDPSILQSPRWLARKLARQLGLPIGGLIKKLSAKDKRFIWIKRHISAIDMENIKRWNVHGVGFIEEPKRVYPNGQLLSQVIGFVGAEDNGLEGLELQHENLLKGESRRLVLPKDARGRPLLADARVLTDIPDGADLTLTVDSELQFIVESELKNAMERHQAEGAIGIVLDARTSEILALASAPSFDLNEAMQLPSQLRRNKPITDVYEPGSTLKTFVVATALKENLVKPSTKYNCEGGKLKIGNRWIKEADSSHNYDWLTVSEILAYSSNVGMAKIAFQLGEERVRQGLQLFGFGDKTGVDLPGESRGILKLLPWRPHFLSNVSFGHGLAVTPLQIASAYAAIANGGVLRKPYMIKSITRAADGKVTDFTSQDLHRVLTSQEAATMTLMLTSATEVHATGYRARINGFPVAGKTGTAQKVDLIKGGYRQGEYISSFAGFVPAHDPRFVIYVALDNPQKDYYGSQVAAPIFSHIAQFAVRKAGLSPILLSEKNVISNVSAAVEKQSLKIQALKDLKASLQVPEDRVPDFTGLSLREVYRRVRGQRISVGVKGSGVVTRMEPSPGEELPASRRLILYLEDVH